VIENNNNMIKNSFTTKVLVMGFTAPYGKALSYAEAFKNLGCEVGVLNIEDYYTPKLINRVLNKFVKLNRYYGIKKLNNAILEKTTNFRPNFVFFIKPIYIKLDTVRLIQNKGIKALSWYPDDMFNPKSASSHFYKSIPLYDCHFTTKSFNVSELLNNGAKKAIFLPHAVNTLVHHPVEVNEKEKHELGADVVFAGTGYEDDRAEHLEKLCRLGHDIKVYGNQWEKRGLCKCLRKKGYIMNKPVYHEDFCRVMSSSKIALAFLSKFNRDLQTSRTYEIPACGIFMLHERSTEAMELYKEGVEAEFFGSFEELREKIDYYLAHDEERREMTDAGYKRATTPEFSYRDRARKVLQVYSEISK